MYSNEESEILKTQYLANPTRETVKTLAEKFEKSERSVIGKLSKMGVYRREVYLSKTGELPVLKKDLVGDIATLLEIEIEDLVGLDKAPKQVLKRLKDELNNWFGEDNEEN